MYSMNDIRRGLKIEFKGEPYEVIEFLHVKPGKGQAFVRTKIKNLITGAVLEQTFRSSDKIAPAELEEKEMQFLYKDGEQYHFMDMESYDQIFLLADQIEYERQFLKENMIVEVLFYKGKPISVELPNKVELRIVQTEPGVKGDTVSGGSKPAVLETGATIQVPLFVNEGDVVRVDTRTGEYLERV